MGMTTQIPPPLGDAEVLPVRMDKPFIRVGLTEGDVLKIPLIERVAATLLLTGEGVYFINNNYKTLDFRCRVVVSLWCSFCAREEYN